MLVCSDELRRGTEGRAGQWRQKAFGLISGSPDAAGAPRVPSHLDRSPLGATRSGSPAAHLGSVNEHTMAAEQAAAHTVRPLRGS